MKKKLSILAVGTLCTLSLAAGALATGVIEEIKAQLRPDFTVVIDGEVKNFKNTTKQKTSQKMYVPKWPVNKNVIFFKKSIDK